MICDTWIIINPGHINSMTGMLYESGVDPLIAMKIVGHKDHQTTADIYTHIKEEMLKKATVDLEGVFKKRAGKE